jgi:hypothetical protein
MPTALPGHDLGHALDGPAAAQGADLFLDPFHPLVIGACRAENELADCPADGLRSTYQALAVERRHECERARPRNDGFIEVKKAAAAAGDPPPGVSMAGSIGDDREIQSSFTWTDW